MKYIAGNGKQCLKTIKGVCLCWQNFCRCRRPWLFHARSYCYWWEIIPSKLYSVKRILVGWFSGSWTQKCWDHFGSWPLWFGGEITLAEGLDDRERQTVLLMNCTLAFTLQLRKSMENLSVQSWEVKGFTWGRRKGRLREWANQEQTYITRNGWVQKKICPFQGPSDEVMFLVRDYLLSGH
jgi:hypothetical protein